MLYTTTDSSLSDVIKSFLGSNVTDVAIDDDESWQMVKVRLGDDHHNVLNLMISQEDFVSLQVTWGI